MEVRLLGPIEVRRRDEPVLIRARLQRAVLVVLAIERGRVVPAERLVGELWSGSPPPKATASLHAAVAHLRRALEPQRTARSGGSVIVTAARGYRLDSTHLDVDVDRFEAAVARARALLDDDPAAAGLLLAEALALWRGPALTEFADEPFARAAAGRLEELRLAAVELRAAALLRTGDPDQVLAEVQPHVTAHPLREQARALQAHALYLAGRQAEALATLSEGRRVLRDELGLDPGPELARMEQRILRHDAALHSAGPPRPAAADPPGPSAGAARRPPLHGRDDECTRLARAVADAAAGAGGVVLLTGDAGMGKSTLLAALAGLVADRGGVARAAACRDGPDAPPFWPVVQLLRDAAATLPPDARPSMLRALGPMHGLVPDLAGDPPAPSGGVDPGSVRVHLSAALRVALGPASAGHGRDLSLVAFDDVHQADPATLQLLTGLAGDVQDRPALLALAVRDGEGTDSGALAGLLAALGRLPRLVRLDLSALPESAVAELVRAAAGTDLDPAAVTGVVARAEGNPFFAQELARLAAAGAPDGGLDRGRPIGGVPASVFDVLRQRFLRLPPAGLRLLTAAAVAGGAMTVADLAWVADVPVEEALTHLEDATEARLAVDAGAGRFAVAHALIAESLRASVSSARIARLHRRVAERLAGQQGHLPEQASRVAAHHLAARHLDGGAAAVPWLERASDHAVRVSALTQLRSVNEQLLTVLAGLPADPVGGVRRELRARSRIAYADVWDRGFDGPSVREYCRLVRSWAVPETPEGDDVELLWVAAVFEAQVGRLDDAGRTAARMAALAPRVGGGTAAFLAADQSAVVHWMQGRFADALADLDRAERACADGRVDLGRSLAFSPPVRIAVVRAFCLWHLGDPAAARAVADQALSAAEAVGLGAAGFARRWALVLALVDGDVERVRTLVRLQLAEHTWERLRYPSAVLRFAEGWLATREGRATDGLAEMRAAHAALVEQGLVGGRSILLGLLAEAALRLGDSRQAAAWAEAGLAIGERGERYRLPELRRLQAVAAGAGEVGAHQVDRKTPGPGSAA